MSSHLKMATDVRQKSSEQANATGQLLKQEFDRLGNGRNTMRMQHGFSVKFHFHNINSR
ncbi:hypothetical protein H0L60_002782 [Salmonella enterica]|nr:hypothetical protein [Salmonella enterica]EFR3498264.1 hypothetical protein [Salmonella enterica]